MATALTIGCFGIARSGPLWIDAPQYANAGAMLRDWMRSGQLLHPFAFAQANYARYPAFSVPYHPPGYPALLGAFFLLAGVSYGAARVFIALLLGVAGCAFYLILRRLAVARLPAAACGLLLLTLPEVARWSRDTMSEIPAFAFVLVASYWFVRWLDTERYRDSVLAFGFAGLAFFSKINVVGVLLAWPVWLVMRGRWRRMLSPSLLVPGVVFLVVTAAWVRFFVPFARYETQFGLTAAELAAARAVGVTPMPEAELWMFLQGLPGMMGWGTLVASAVGLAVGLARVDARRDAVMWLAWFAGYLVFLLVLPLHYEARYFTFGLAAAPAVVALLFPTRAGARVPVWLAYGLVAVALIDNVSRVLHLPRGVVGYEQVARRLAALDAPGNVLVSVPVQNDLIFRYRAASPESGRQFIRGDRSVAMVLPNYAPVANRMAMLVREPESFVQLVRRGRARYIVSVAEGAAFARPDQSFAEDMVLVDRLVRSLPEQFASVDSFWVDFGGQTRAPGGWVHVWQYRQPLPPGPSQIPITIPTARLKFRAAP